jgi:chromosomal replication initiator protein
VVFALTPVTLRLDSEGNLTGTRTAQEIWEAALGELQVQFNKANYRTWLQNTVGLSYQDNRFVVGTPNTFVSEYLDRNQRSLIEKTLIGLTCGDIEVHFSVDGRHQEQEAAPPPQPASPGCNPRYTFDSFVVGNCNRLAYAAALGVAESPAKSYNPLFIYGGAGLGKTHLLHAIWHVAQVRQARVIYVSAEEFTNEFVAAIRERKTNEFRRKFRGVDMLLIDDIQFISGKEQTEESFFHTFNELHNASHQIVITSDRLPKSMPLLEDRLRSRFEWGLITDIEPPDFETRLAILQVKAAQEGVNLPPAVLEFIAHRVKQNIRRLEGSLNRVIAYAHLTGASPTPELASRALEDLAARQPLSAPISPTLVIESVASSFQMTPEDLTGRKRDRETALARQVAMFLLHQETDSSLAQIGEALGGRDHSTVTHALQKIAADIDASSPLRRKILDIQQRMHTRPKGATH